MAKFAFVVPPFYGHFNVTLSLGKELLKRGNEVAWIGVNAELKENLPAGGKFLFITHDYDEQAIREMKKKGGTIQGIESLKILYENALVPLNQFMLDGIVHHLTEYRPDIVIYDYQVFAAAVAAKRLNIPYVASATSQASIKAFDAFPKLHEWEDGQIISFQQRNGIIGDKRLIERASMVLVYTSQLFFGNKEMSPLYQFVGPVIKDRPTPYKFDWDRFESVKHRPCILVSIGTTFDHEEKQSFFQKVIEAFKNEDVTVVMLSDPALFREIPDNFIVQKQVPQLQLLPYMQLVICHGGQNTVAESLYWGIPLIILPIAFDQSQVANDVVLCGAGVRMKFNRFKPEDLKNEVHEILNNETYRENAQKVQTSFREAGGLDRAVTLLENLIKSTTINS